MQVVVVRVIVIVVVVVFVVVAFVGFVVFLWFCFCVVQNFFLGILEPKNSVRKNIGLQIGGGMWE